MLSRLAFFLLFWWFYHRTSAKRTGGIMSSKSDFMYMDRFCFQSDTGALEYWFKYPRFYPTQMLLLYFDTDDQWPRAYKELTTCDERVQLLTNHSDNNQIIFLSPFVNDITGNGRCFIEKNSNGEEWVVCQGTRIFRSARSRWWFLALANCDPSEKPERRIYNNESIGVYTEFRLSMTNGMSGEILKHEFSIDEWLILPSDTLFLLLQLVLNVVAYLMGRSLTARRLYHNTYRMCSQSIAMNTVGLAFLVANYMTYAWDGVGLPIILTTGHFIRALADMLYMYTCLVLARGLNVVKMKLTVADKVFLGVMFLFFIMSYLCMQIWEIRYFDPAMVYSPSESLPGYMLSVWRLTAWVFFVVAALVSRKAAPQKSFFLSFILLMTPWFWAPPVFALIANFFLNNWVRAEVVNIVENCVTFYGYIVFLYLSRPSDKNHNFPFHIRTTQVDIDVGFDPQTAYGQSTAAPPPNNGMNGVQELAVTDCVEDSERSEDEIKPENKDRGIIERPQFIATQ